jgi:hypothetical protein
MTNLTVPIIFDEKINSIFIKATRYILKKHKNQFNNIKNFDEKLNLLKQLWEIEFFASLITDDKTPTFIQFHSENSMTLFFFKFKD